MGGEPQRGRWEGQGERVGVPGPRAKKEKEIVGEECCEQEKAFCTDVQF